MSDTWNSVRPEEMRTYSNLRRAFKLGIYHGRAAKGFGCNPYPSVHWLHEPWQQGFHRGQIWQRIGAPQWRVKIEMAKELAE